MKRLLLFSALAFLAALAAGVSRAGARAADPLRIIFIDVEGGAATLIVTPAGESILVDTGWPGFEDRDPKRIQGAAKEAGVSRIDHLVTTHWHVDHYGGLGRLSELVPVGRFYDRGIPERLEEDPTNFPTLIAAYRKASHGRSITLRPGDPIRLERPDPAGAAHLQLTCLAANAEVVPAREGAAPNPECARHEAKPEDRSDNARSIVLLLDFGDFEFLDCGDLTWNIEQKLVCPVNRIGKIDVYQVTHHGADSSNNPVLVRSIQPQVAVINNGPRKGGEKGSYATLRDTPGIEAIFQLHRNVRTGDADNAPAAYVANLEAECEGRSVRATVGSDGRRYLVSVEGKGSRSFQSR